MFTYSVKVDAGVTGKKNDDRAVICTQTVSEGEIFGRCDTPYISAAVCDGVGGLAAGYRAAEIVVSEMASLYRPDVIASDIRHTIESTNKSIIEEQLRENLWFGMRTTIAGIYADDNNFFIFNAGDSRVYRFRYKFLTQLSKDHSFVRDLVEIGEISEEEARVHPKKNIITKCLGHEDTVSPYIINQFDDFVAGDIIMICSDGISDELSDAEIKKILFEHNEDENLEAICNIIMNAAIENGSKDNLSIILVRKEES